MRITGRIAWLAAIAVAGCGGESPAAPPGFPVAIAVMSGNSQTGKAGEALSERLVVRVRDAHGTGVAAVPVTWSVTPGGGRVLASGPDGWLEPVTTTLTRTDGIAEVTFLPTRVGRTSVTATAAGVAGEPAIFTTDATVLVIHNAALGVFLAPNDSTEVTVPVGTPVEWHNTWAVLVEILSVSAPPGGGWFDLQLAEDTRVQFVRGVAGSWEWTYQYRDDAGEAIGPIGQGLLTARPDL